MVLLLLGRWLRAHARSTICAGWTAQGRIVLGILALIAGYALIASVTTLWDRDEPRNAKAALEMVQSGDWLVPHFNDQWRLHKPVLGYWLMATNVLILGATDFAVRLPAILGAAVSVFMTWWMVRRLSNPFSPFNSAALGRQGDYARAAALILATSPLLIIAGTAATHDAWLLASICTAIAAFVVILCAQKPVWWATLLLGLALGVAQLTKGPVGLIVPLLTIFGT